MSRLRRFAIAFIAASTVAVGSLAVPATASALPMSCAVRYQLSRAYNATGLIFWSLGDKKTANYWFGMAEGVLVGC